MAVRAEQKQKTRRSLMDAALRQLSADRGFSNLSLREVAREAGIAPTSFYRHFTEMDELGLALVDEAGVTLRQLMRQARKRIEKGGSAVTTSVDTFMEYLASNATHFRLLLRERTGLSHQFRTAIKAEINHFVIELAEDLRRIGDDKQRPLDEPELLAEAMVTIVFTLGAEALDASPKERSALADRIKKELRMLIYGAEAMSRIQRERNKPSSP
ncbi:MAG: HTH-type transcriptional repressor FabR [Hahellaceae bacterium]|nr:HTH-type transcriptional repressor FabR [Hahellaceae bacterium]